MPVEGPNANKEKISGKLLILRQEPAWIVNLKIAVVTHSADFTPVNSSKAAAAGEVLAIFAKDLNATIPSVTESQPFPVNPVAAVNSLVEVRVNGRSTVVFGAVGLPGTVNGYQVNLRLPPI